MDKTASRQRIEHILQAVRLIREFVSGMSAAEFRNDVKVQSAVQYQFLVIGEAIRHVGEGILSGYSYPWHIPRSFRNFIIHEDRGIKPEGIFFATQDLDDLKAQLKIILKNEF